MRIGIDLGGTKIESIALEADREVVPRRRIPTPRDYEATLAAIEAMVREIESTAGRPGSVGVGIPGTISSRTGLVKNANSTWLIGKPLQSDLERRLGRDVAIANDANCFAVSEAVDGAGAGAGVVFGVILGTGVGGGLVIERKPIVGVNGIAGEWGHTPLPWPRQDELPGPECYCGKHGCVETFLSGPALEREYAATTGRDMPARDIVRAAGSGDATAAALIACYDERLARSLSVVINICDPHVIVLGGGMSNAPGIAERVSSLLPRYVFSDSVDTRVVRNRHGDSSGVRGAAWL
jgi:fructokinase